MMKYLRIFLDWIKALWLGPYDELHHPVVPVIMYTRVTRVLIVLLVVVVATQASLLIDVTPDVPAVPEISSTTGLDEDQAPALDADLCQPSPRQFVLNLDGTQIKLSIQE